MAVNKSRIKLRKININKKILISVLAAVALLLGGAFYAIQYTNDTYISTLRSVNSQVNEDAYLAVRELKTRTQIDKNGEIINSGNESYEASIRLLSDNDRLRSQMYSTIKEHCSDTSRFTADDIPTGWRITLLSTERKQYLEKLSELFEKADFENKKSCSTTVGNEEFEKVMAAITRGYLDMNEAAKDDYARMDLLENLAKFSDGSFQVASIGEIVKASNDGYEKWINNEIKAFAAFYESYKAVKANNQELNERKFDEYTKAANDSQGLFQSALDRYNEERKKETRISLDLSIEAYDLYRDMNAGLNNTDYSQSVMTADLIAGALYAYSADNEGKLPKASSIETLVTYLTDKRYIDKVEVDVATVTYRIVDKKNAKLSFTSEINDEQYEIEIVGAE